ncbi:MAG: hypothetical protein EBU31_01075 [Proteobacteria bacterium]|jgi:hypothetical protein|nr:hypothetical protein [Pseudomonadota bacterium]
MDQISPSPLNTTTVVDSLRLRSDDYLISSYIQLRDGLDAQKKEQTKANAPITAMMHTISNVLLERLNDRGAINTRTENGTAYVSQDVSVTVRGWSETLPFIREHDLWELLEARVNKSAALEVMAERGTDIPGVVVRRENVVHIRRTT